MSKVEVELPPGITLESVLKEIKRRELIRVRSRARRRATQRVLKAHQDEYLKYLKEES